MLELMQDEVFKAFSTYALIVILKTMLMSPFTSFYRIRKGVGRTRVVSIQQLWTHFNAPHPRFRLLPRRRMWPLSLRKRERNYWEPSRMSSEFVGESKVCWDSFVTLQQKNGRTYLSSHRINEWTNNANLLMLIKLATCFNTLCKA